MSTTPAADAPACTLGEAVAHIRARSDDRRSRAAHQAEPRCGALVSCRCGFWSCCVCVYVKAHGLCSPVGEARPCR